MSECAGDPLVQGYSDSITYRDDREWLWVLDVGGPNCGSCGTHRLAAAAAVAADGCHDDSLSSRDDVRNGNDQCPIPTFGPRRSLHCVSKGTQLTITVKLEMTARLSGGDFVTMGILSIEFCQVKQKEASR